MRHLLIAVGMCSLLALAALCPDEAGNLSGLVARASEPQKRRAPHARRGRKAAPPVESALVKSSTGLRITVLSVESAGESWADSTGRRYTAGDGQEIMLVHLRLKALPGVRGDRKFEFASPTLYMSDGTIADTDLGGFNLYQDDGAPLDTRLTLPFVVPAGTAPGALSVGDADFDLAGLGVSDAPEAPGPAGDLAESLRRHQEVSEMLRRAREHQKSIEESMKLIDEIKRQGREAQRRAEEMNRIRMMIQPLPDLSKMLVPLPPAAGEIAIPAGKFSRGVNVEVGVLRQWGVDFVHNAAPYRLGTPNEVEYEIKVEGGGAYELSVQLAAEESRPVDIVLNGETVFRRALGVTTGSWHQDSAKWFDVGRLHLRPGANSLVIRRDDVFPHLVKVRLTRAK
jgi:hypothetical protein